MEIIVRPTTVEDAAALVEIYSQPKAQRETLQLPKPSLAMWVERLSNMPAGVYSYVAEIDGKVVGNIGFHHSQRPRTAHTAAFGIGVHDQFHGIGVGSKLIETITELASSSIPITWHVSDQVKNKEKPPTSWRLFFLNFDSPS